MVMYNTMLNVAVAFCLCSLNQKSLWLFLKSIHSG